MFICIWTSASFGQNSLEYYLQSAIKNSPIFIENQNRLNVLSLDSLLLLAKLKPQVNFTSNNLYSPIINGYGYDEIITNKGNYNALLGANYTIVGKKSRNNQNASLNIQRQILALNSKLGERDLKQTVTSQYITVYADQQIISNKNEILAVLQKENLLLKSAAEKGIYRQTDYLAFLENYKQQQIVYAQNKMQMEYDFYMLNYICGISDTTTTLLESPDLKTSGEITIEETTSFQQYYLDSIGIRNSMEQLHFNYKPRLNFLGDAGYYTSFQYHSEKNFGASVGLNLSVPIYDGNQHSLQNEKLNLAENTRSTKKEFLKKQFSLTKTQLSRQISQTEELIAMARDQLQISRSLLQANNQLLETGDIKITDYILSLTNCFTSQATVQQLITNKMQLIIQFNFLNY